MKQIIMKTVVLALALGFGGAAMAADDTTNCGSKQVKAYAGLFNSLIKEGARACGKADSDAEADVRAEVNADKMIKVGEKFNSAIAKSVNKYGQANCFVEDSPAGAVLDPADAVVAAEDFGVQLCTSSP